MSEIQKYLEALGMRKMINKKMSGESMNYAVVSQIERDDIPRMLEIIRVLDNAIRAIIDLSTDEQELCGTDDAEAAMRVAAAAHLKGEELAAAGSKSRWGDYEPGQH